MEPQEKYADGSIPVPADWEEVFSPFYFAANNGDAPVRKTLAPSFQNILLFSFGPPVVVHLPDGGVEVVSSMAIGPLKAAPGYTLQPGGRILAANFMPDAFYRLFGQNLRVRSQYLNNPDAQGHRFSSLHDALANEPDDTKRVEMVLGKTADYLPANASSAQTGPNAKECHRHRRFLRAVELLNKRGTPDWFDVIDQCGFYDQGHLLRDFDHYLGISPAGYLQLREEVRLAGS